MRVQVSSTYKQFFARNMDERFVMLQGGRRSGKTWATLTAMLAISVGRRLSKVMVVGATYPMLSETMADFELITGLPVRGSKYGNGATIGSTRWVFRCFDHPTKAQGTSADLIFFNEAAKCDPKMITTALLSTRAQVFMDYNPTRDAGLDKYITPSRSNLLLTTWRDNAYLTDAQRANFADLEAAALAPNASEIDKYMASVYAAGEYYDMHGAALTHWSECEAWPIGLKTYFGIDFGYTNDPVAIVEVGFDRSSGTIYARERLYQPNLSDLELAPILTDIVPSDATVVFDWGAGGDARAANLAMLTGLSMYPATKGAGSIDGGLRLLNQYHIKASGEHLLAELAVYSPDKEGNDHTIDALRYAFTTLYSNGD